MAYLRSPFCRDEDRTRWWLVAHDAPCVFPGYFWGDGWDSWVLSIHGVIPFTAHPARRLPQPEGTCVAVGSHLEQALKPCTMAHTVGAAPAPCLQAQPPFFPASPSDERGPAALLSRSSACAACAGESLPLLEDVLRSPPAVHSSADSTPVERYLLLLFPHRLHAPGCP